MSRLFPMRVRCELAIVGSGFGGSILSMMAGRLGLDVCLIERGCHPRFVIGESSTPLANLLLEEIARDYQLPLLAPFTSWGAWQRTHPKIGCGLKRGFSFFLHQLGQKADVIPRERQFLVAASPSDAVSDTHWYRPDFDAFLVDEARKMGAVYLDKTELTSIREDSDFIRLKGTRNRKIVDIEARFVVDAGGGRGFLRGTLNLPSERLPQFERSSTFYAHFRHVGSPALHPAESKDIPYETDHSAVHHLFEGGWIWVLKFNNGITSAGAVARPDSPAYPFLKQGWNGWKTLLSQLPAAAAQFATAAPATDGCYSGEIAFRCLKITGHRWALLPSAAGFVDPMLSTGFPLTLFGLQRLGPILKGLRDASATSEKLRAYEMETLADLESARKLLAALYANFGCFDRFKSLCLLYFAAASYSEMARRLGRGELASKFLLGNNESFSAGFHALCGGAMNTEGLDEDLWRENLHRFIEPIDIGGFVNADGDAYIPVNTQALIQSAAKLNATGSEINQLLKTFLKRN